MALPTLPDDKQQDKLHNPGEHDYDRKFNDTDISRGIDEAENYANGGSQDNIEQGLRDLENYANGTPRDDQSVAERESAGDFVNNYTGARQAVKTTQKVLWKRGGIIGGGVVIAIIFVLVLLSGFLPVAGLLLNLSETATANRDVQGTILDRRLAAVVDNKITGGISGDICDTSKAACRMKMPSNAFLTRLQDKGGIKAFYADGTEVARSTSGYPKERPARFEFKTARGTTITVDAKSFSRTLQTNAEFRKAFTKAYNMRFWAYSNNTIKKVFYGPNGVDRSGNATADIDPDNPSETVRKIAGDADDDNPVRKAGSDADAKNTAAREALEDAVDDKVEQSTKKLVKAKGDPVLTIGTMACIGMNVPGMITDIVRLYQMRQVIALAAAIVLTPASQLKAGDLSPETMSAIGALLTTAAISSGSSSPKSAMDSFGIRNVLFSDTNTGGSSTYKKFIPGGTISKDFAGINEVANNPQVKEACELVYSPQAAVASATISAGIGAATGGTGAVVIAALKAAGIVVTSFVAADFLIDALSGPISTLVGEMIKLIPPETIAAALANPDVENATNEDLGNVLGPGLAFFFSQSSLSTGTAAPLSTAQLAEYNQLSQDSMIAYAEQDRVGRSPFDISSPYTFLGSIVSNFYKNSYIPGSAIQSTLASIGYIIRQPFGGFTSNTYAAADNLVARCGFAEEFGVDSSVGVGAFGDICAGIPAQYMNLSTNTVLENVSGMYNETTGEPTVDGDISIMQGDCSGGSLLSAKGCVIEDEARASQSLYLTDYLINSVLDGEDQ